MPITNKTLTIQEQEKIIHEIRQLHVSVYTQVADSLSANNAVYNESLKCDIHTKSVISIYNCLEALLSDEHMKQIDNRPGAAQDTLDEIDKFKMLLRGYYSANIEAKDKIKAYACKPLLIEDPKKVSRELEPIFQLIPSLRKYNNDLLNFFIEFSKVCNQHETLKLSLKKELEHYKQLEKGFKVEEGVASVTLEAIDACQDLIRTVFEKTLQEPLESYPGQFNAQSVYKTSYISENKESKDDSSKSSAYAANNMFSNQQPISNKAVQQPEPAAQACCVIM